MCNCVRIMCVCVPYTACVCAPYTACVCVPYTSGKSRGGVGLPPPPPPRNA